MRMHTSRYEIIGMQRVNFGRKGGLVWQESRENQKTWRKSM